MKIFFTVGTTRFDSLIEAIANDGYFKDHECILQVGPGGRQLAGFECFEYTKDIDSYYAAADVVVTHAGAGSIYKLLEMRKRIVVVPNTDRLDSHQSDIANYMDKNGYAIAANDLSRLSECVRRAAEADLKLFEKTDFFAAKEIVEFIAS